MLSFPPIIEVSDEGEISDHDYDYRRDGVVKHLGRTDLDDDDTSSSDEYRRVREIFETLSVSSGGIEGKHHSDHQILSGAAPSEGSQSIYLHDQAGTISISGPSSPSQQIKGSGKSSASTANIQDASVHTPTIGRAGTITKNSSGIKELSILDRLNS